MMGEHWCQAPPSPHCPLGGLPALSRAHLKDLCPPLTLLAGLADSSFSFPRSPSAWGEAVWYKHMLSQGWGRVRSSWMPQDLDYQRLLFQISVFFLLIQSGWKIPQPGSNLSSCKVCAISQGCFCSNWASHDKALADTLRHGFFVMACQPPT